MGRKKVSTCSLVKNEIHRAVTYSKRKKGLIKKAVELSNMCD